MNSTVQFWFSWFNEVFYGVDLICRQYPYLPHTRGDGVLFSIDLFVCLFVSLSARLRENGWTDFHDIFREGVEWSRNDLLKFRVNSGKWVGGSKVNLLSPDIAIWFDCCLMAVLCCHIATENAMKWLFWPYCYIVTRGGGCCALHPHHSLLMHFYCTIVFFCF